MTNPATEGIASGPAWTNPEGIYRGPVWTFLREHHAQWNALRETKMFHDLCGLMDTMSPAKHLPDDAQALFQFSPVFLNQVKGWELAHSFIRTLGDIPKEQQEPQSTYPQGEE